ncbi:MAG: hypothetical protein FJ288_12070 [Planctomycetes bacterium]|nr:hypothetical protein [Planctomycetota bacterium]
MRIRKVFQAGIAAVLVALLFGLAPGATDNCIVSITGTVDPFAEWSAAAPAIAAGEFTGSVDGTTISQVGEVLEATKGLTLYANANVTVTAAGTANSGIATNGTETLTTKYKITGDVTVPDAAWKTAGSGVGQFFNAGNSYSVTHVAGDGSYAIDLSVRLEAPADRSPDAGDYTCSITLTATW